MPSTKPHNPRPSMVGSVVRIIIQFISWLISQLILIIIMAWHGHQAEFLASTKLLTNEIFNLSQQISSPSITRYFLNQLLGFINYLQTVSNNVPSFNTPRPEIKNHTTQTLIHIIYPLLTDYVKSAIAITQIVLLRITNVFLFIPLIILLGLVAISNGLVDRYLRRINGGHESSLIYHYAKISIKPFIFWGSMLYIALPFPLAPVYFLLPCAIASSCAVYLTVKSFKKYA